MFERYTEKARRVIFFARYEASQYGSHYIDTEHILLGLMREDRPLMSTMIGSGNLSETVRQEVEKRIQRGERFSTADRGTTFRREQACAELCRGGSRRIG